MGPPATDEQIQAAVTHFGTLPKEFMELVREVTELEVQHRNGPYLRIWGPSGCVEMDEGYQIRQRIPSAMPIGDDGGGKVLFYSHGSRGHGLYCVGYGDLDINDATWVSATLGDLLENAKGANAF
jgi:hypothetical protein